MIAGFDDIPVILNSKIMKMVFHKTVKLVSIYYVTPYQLITNITVVEFLNYSIMTVTQLSPTRL